MTPTLLTAIGAIITAIFAALLPFYREHLKDRREAEKAEKARAEARDRTLAEMQEWAQGVVANAVEAERETYTTIIAQHAERIGTLERHLGDRDAVIDALRAEIEMIRKLAERLAQLVAQIDPYKTPTQEQMQAMRETAERMGLRPSVVPSLVIARGGSK